MEMQEFRDKTATVRPSEGQGSAARALGVVETPREVVTFMVNLALEGMGGALSVLEPACGSCPFLTAFRGARGPDSVQDRYVGVEVRSEVVKASSTALQGFRLVLTDFLLWETHERFDIVIGNPPYGIIGEPGQYPISVFREMKRIYRRLFATWCGKYNIYGAFIEKGLALLKPHGKLVYVVPRTFMFLDDFTLLRKFMSQVGRVSVHYLGSVFPGKNVVAVVLVVEKGKRGLRVMEWNSILYERPEYRGDIIRFEDASTEAFERGKVPLGRVFEIHFAARSPQIKSHPLTSRRPDDGTVPVLTGRNLKAGKIDYETCYSGFYFPLKDARLLRPFYGVPHIVVAHTKGARVVAALDKKCYPWREEFHLTARRIGLDQSAIVS
jgi:adenine-specific DNA-methyltransferase